MFSTRITVVGKDHFETVDDPFTLVARGECAWLAERLWPLRRLRRPKLQRGLKRSLLGALEMLLSDA